MHEIIEQIINFLRGVWRYHWHAIIIVWIVAISGWTVVYRMPDVYESSARVYVDTDSVLRPLLSGLAIRPNISQRLELMTRTLLSRPNLEKIARMSDLDLTVSSPEEMEGLINELSEKVKLRSSRRQNLYTISYEHHDPETAAKVVRSVLTIFVESTLGESREDTDSAQRFLMEQIREHEKRLSEMEDQIKEFKKKNLDLIMARGGRSYFDRLQAAEGALAKARLELEEVVRRRDELARQLRGEEPVFGFGNQIIQGQVSTQLPIDARINALQSQLDELLLRYTERHPEVINLKKTIARLEKEKSKLLSVITESSESVITPSVEQNPIYQQMRIALGEAEARAAALSARVKEYENRVRQLRNRVDTALDIETRLLSMNRNYDITKKNYEALVARLESAKLSEEAEKTGEDIKFRTIDPPRVPVAPSGPNRILLSSAVLFAAIVAGVIFAFLLAQIRPVIYDRKALQQITGLPVFGTVSVLKTRQIRKKQRLDIGGFAAVCGLLFVIYVGVLIEQSRDINWSDPVSIMQAIKEIL